MAPVSTVTKVSAKGILFDMDGVLISSIGSVVRCWRRWAEMYEVPNADTYEVPHGTRAIDIVKILRPDIDPQVGLRVIEDMEMEDMAAAARQRHGAAATRLLRKLLHHER